MSKLPVETLFLTSAIITHSSVSFILLSRIQNPEGNASEIFLVSLKISLTFNSIIYFLISSYRLVNRDYPQGSALGPLLWNIFQNDLLLCIATKPSMYADDHQIYHSGHDLEEVTSQLSVSADQATKWYESNLLAGNLKKYQTLNIGYSKKADSSANAVIHAYNQEIKTADTLKLLGVTIDSKLNFSEHVSSACKMASERIGVLMRLRDLIPTKATLQLYKSAVLPYLTYCHLAWHFCRASDARKLERSQERGLRAVYKDKQASYFQLQERAKLPTLANRRYWTSVFLSIKLNTDYVKIVSVTFLVIKLPNAT